MGHTIMFTTVYGDCFPSALALAGQCGLLVDGGGLVFTERDYSINLRIEVFDLFSTPKLPPIPFLSLQWPGYDGWTAQVSIPSHGQTGRLSHFLDQNRYLPGGFEKYYSCEVGEGSC